MLEVNAHMPIEKRPLSKPEVHHVTATRVRKLPEQSQLVSPLADGTVPESQSFVESSETVVAAPAVISFLSISTITERNDV
jgi:hypothetical protein